MMKSMWRVAVSAGLVMLGSAGLAVAGPIGQTGSFTWTRQTDYHTGSGGEFSIANYTGINNNSYVDTGTDMTSTKNIGTTLTGQINFETFCLETGEYAASPSYFVVGSAAARGGTVSSTDTISKGTAYLYSEFAKGTLIVTGGNYFAAGTPTRATEAGRLQQAIWWLEGETSNISDATYATNPYANAVVTMFNGIAGAKADATAGYRGVYVLNNFTTAAARDEWVTGTFDSTKKAQDFLYYQVPDAGATVVLLGGALVGLGALRRKFTR